MKCHSHQRKTGMHTLLLSQSTPSPTICCNAFAYTSLHLEPCQLNWAKQASYLFFSYFKYSRGGSLLIFSSLWCAPEAAFVHVELEVRLRNGDVAKPISKSDAFCNWQSPALSTLPSLAPLLIVQLLGSSK